MQIGYNLLSKDYLCPEEKSTISPVDLLKKAGCKKVYSDRNPQNRKQLNKVFSILEPGYILVVPNLKVLGSDPLSFLQYLNLLQEKGVHLQSLEENYLFSSESLPIKGLTLISSLFSSENKLESPPSTSTETHSHQGRPRLPHEILQFIKYLRIDNPKISITSICKIVNISRQSYYNYFPKDSTSQSFRSEGNDIKNKPAPKTILPI